MSSCHAGDGRRWMCQQDYCRSFSAKSAKARIRDHPRRHFPGSIRILPDSHEGVEVGAGFGVDGGLFRACRVGLAEEAGEGKGSFKKASNRRRSGATSQVHCSSREEGVRVGCGAGSRIWFFGRSQGPPSASGDRTSSHDESPTGDSGASEP